MPLPRRCACALVAALLAAMVGSPVSAGSFRVMPVRIEMEPGTRFCSLTIVNEDSETLTLQARGYRWTMDAAGADVLSEEPGLQLNPTIMTLAPGEQRLVRCALPAGPEKPQDRREQSWRLVLDELPSSNHQQAGTIRTLLRVSLPVFRTPGAAKAELAWGVGEDFAGRPSLLIANSGQRNTQILGLELVQATHPPVSLTRAFYILAGTQVTVPLPAGLEIRDLVVRARTATGTLVLPNRLVR